jgi:nicotinamide-nucleotide amidase
MNVNVITIGDEILIGQIVDTNSAWIGQQLNLIGLEINQSLTVSDTRYGILEGLKHAAKDADVILLTGGLGPTKDDITKKVLAEYFGVELHFNEIMWKHITGILGQKGYPVQEAHRTQCYLPANCNMLHNKMGTAPGMWFEYQGKTYVSMPGVPYEMKYLMEFEVLPKLKTKFVAQAIVHRTIRTAGVGEGVLARDMEDFETNLPQSIKLAYLPSIGQVRLRLTARGTDEAALNSLLDEKVEAIKKLIPQYIYGYETETIPEVIGQICKAKGVTIGTLESCTGGFIAHQLTAIPGSSAYYKGSVIAYSNEMKMKMLEVSAQTLEEYGAVSEQTVIEMVKGGLKALNVDYAIAVSGIAGPDGGTPDKPVGTIWFAVGNQDKIEAHLLTGSDNRMINIERTTNIGLNILRKFLLSN